jgi:polar amino acid transport system substrate-binding protein
MDFPSDSGAKNMHFCNRLGRNLLAVACLAGAAITTAHAAAPLCQPTKLASLYPGLVGKTITIGQDGESPPFSMRDPKDFNRIIGLDADLARAVFKCVGVPVKFTTGSWSGLIPAAMSGQIDVMWDQLLYTPERAKKLDFIAYMNSATGILVAKGNPKHLTSLDSLCGAKVTANLGTTQETMVHEQSAKCTATGKPPLEVISSSDIPSGLRLVQSGRADALVGNKFVVDNMAATHPADTESAFSVVTGAKLAAGTAKGNPDLVKAMLNGLTTLHADGTLKRIFDENHVDYSLAIEPAVLSQ